MSTYTVSPLRQRMIEDMNARKLGAGTQRGHIHSCKRFTEFLKRSPDTATAEDIRRFQLHLSETGMSICNRNRIMTGVKFLLRVTLRRLDLAAEIYHIREPQKIPQVMSPDETRRVLAVATSLKARVALSLCYGCGLRADSSERTRNARSRGRPTPRAAAPMPVLRRPHDRHRDLLARLPAEAPAHAASAGNQDRHLMMPSPSIHHASNARYFCRLSAGSEQARIGALHSQAVARPIRSLYGQIARSHRRMRPCFAANRSPQLPQSSLSKPQSAAKSP